MRLQAKPLSPSENMSDILPQMPVTGRPRQKPMGAPAGPDGSRKHPAFPGGHRYRPVTLCPFSRISCGVPAATIRPPLSPPPGPMSMI